MGLIKVSEAEGEEKILSGMNVHTPTRYPSIV